MNKNKLGYIYILTNPCFKENWIKIGFTDNVDKRIKELSQATGIPLPFEMYATLKTAKYIQAEKMIHKMIGLLSPEKRINPRREFFNLEAEEAVTAFKMVAELLDDSEFAYNDKIVSTPKTSTAESGEAKKKAPPKTFYSMGLKDGDTIEFIPDPQFKAIVSGERTVMFEEQEYLLTPLTNMLCERIGHRTNIASGFDTFRYDDQDRNLYMRWCRLNEELIKHRKTKPR